ncbi:hypothetical protein XENORESO_010728 [Xenotaenia resolanae]|uniref:Laminin G domain-containing protein n=1 Tax=Xenotaenia resolanae TaxID=208358 RepID=A0ABV0WSG5_9TELE
MQVSKEDVQVSVTGGPKLNDGKWHTVDLSNQGKFVILEVDSSPGLVVGMHSKQTKEVISGELRLALGGILTTKDKMIVQMDPQMDGCVREGRWLNLNIPWVADAEELWLCHQNIRPGSFFAGEGFSIFNTSGCSTVAICSDKVFNSKSVSGMILLKVGLPCLFAVFSIDEDQGFKVEFWGDFSQMDGTILSIMSSQEELLGALEIHLTIRKEKHVVKNTLKRLQITFLKYIVKWLIYYVDESNEIAFSYGPESTPGNLTTLTEGRFAIGGLLGGGKDMVGSHFLTGCLEKIQVQGKDLDLDSAVKDMSASSHSCPA